MSSLQNHLFFQPVPSFSQISTTHHPNVVLNIVSTPTTAAFSKFPLPHFPNLHQKQVQTRKVTSLLKVAATHLSNSRKIQVSDQKNASFFNIRTALLQTSLQNHLWTVKHASFLGNCLKFQLPFALVAVLSIPSPSLAAETEQVSDKINIESILVSIDDFFNRNPFFVAGVTFIWLVVIPLTQEYLKKYKFISAIDAFRKLRDEPNSQLLDIRNKKSLMFLGSPNLKILNKDVVQVEFSEADEQGFVKEVLKNLGDPGNTIICVLDNFDGNSLRAAELLFKNGFKEAYAIKGGLRGKNGWQAIQETLLPPSVHVYARKKKSEVSTQSNVSRQRINEQTSGNGQAPTTARTHQDENLNAGNGYVKPMETAAEAKLAPERPLSPFPNYPDLKPPSSPTPSKPQS